MLAISRQNLIKELLQENKSVTIADLAVRMNVTRETIRRDLRAMEKEHALTEAKTIWIFPQDRY